VAQLLADSEAELKRKRNQLSRPVGCSLFEHVDPIRFRALRFVQVLA
jgi:hypothetical protein